MPTYAGNAATYPTSIYAADDLTTDSAANRGATYQGLADRTAFLKANAPIQSAQVGSDSAFGTALEQIGGSGVFEPSSVLTTTIANVPSGAVIIADAFLVASCTVTGNARLEILEGSTVTPDAYAKIPFDGTNAKVNLSGRFVKNGTGSVTVRVAALGGPSDPATIASPCSLRVQVQRQF